MVENPRRRPPLEEQKGRDTRRVTASDDVEVSTYLEIAEGKRSELPLAEEALSEPSARRWWFSTLALNIVCS